MEYAIFIDESGIHKDSGYSVFVLVYVFTNDYIKINEAIQGIEEKLGIPAFHWSDYSSKYKWNIRKRFIKEILGLDFSFKYMIIKNPINPRTELHNSIVSLLVEKNVDAIYIDGKSSRSHEQSIKNALRDAGISVKKLKTVNDISFPVIRIADALAGILRSYYEKSNKDREALYKALGHKKHKPPF